MMKVRIQTNVRLHEDHAEIQFDENECLRPLGGVAQWCGADWTRETLGPRNRPLVVSEPFQVGDEVLGAYEWSAVTEEQATSINKAQRHGYVGRTKRELVSDFLYFSLASSSIWQTERECRLAAEKDYQDLLSFLAGVEPGSHNLKVKEDAKKVYETLVHGSKMFSPVLPEKNPFSGMPLDYLNSVRSIMANLKEIFS